MTKTFKKLLKEINLNTALLKPRADQIRKQATAGKWDAQDKKDFETAAKFLDKGDLKGFNKFIHTLDSFPRDEILHSAGLWNTKLPESMSYVGQNVSQKLSYDNWLKKIKGIEKGAHGIKGDEHTKLSKQWRDYKKEEVELEEGYEGHIIAHLGELGIDTRFSYGKLVVKKADLARVKDALKDGASDGGSLIYQKRIPEIVTEGIELEEGRMKELHTLIQQGKSAEEIAKIMKLDVKTVKALMPKEESKMNPSPTKHMGGGQYKVDPKLAAIRDKKNKARDKLIKQGKYKEEEVNEVSPPGWGGSVKAMKKHADIDNPYALAWHMKNKGDKPHYKDKDGTPVKKDKYKDEQMTEELTEKLEVKWDKDKEGWYDKQGRRRYLGKAATQDLLGKQIAKAKASGDWSSFDLDRSRFEEKETDMKKEDHDCAKVHPDKPHQEWAKDSLKKAQYETHRYFDVKPGSIEDSINKVKELEETSVTINKKEIDDLVKRYIAKGGVVTKLPPALAPDHEPSKEWDLVKGKSVPGSNQGQVAYKVKKVGSGYKILKAQLREFIRIYNEHFLTNYAAEEFIVEEK